MSRVPTEKKQVSHSEKRTESITRVSFEAGQARSMSGGRVGSPYYGRASNADATITKQPSDDTLKIANLYYMAGSLLEVWFTRTNTAEAKTYTGDDFRCEVTYTLTTTSTETVFKVKHNETAREKIKLNGSIITPKA